MEIVNKENITFQDFYDKHKLLDNMIERDLVISYLRKKGYIGGEGGNQNVSFAKPTNDSYIFHIVKTDDLTLQQMKFELMYVFLSIIIFLGDLFLKYTLMEMSLKERFLIQWMLFLHVKMG